MGLFQRIYPDGIEETKLHDHFWIHNGESRGTLGRNGPSLLQRLTTAWVEDFGLAGGASSVSAGDWAQMLRALDPEIPE
jgi:hypothetical protein